MTKNLTSLLLAVLAVALSAGAVGAESRSEGCRLTSFDHGGHLSQSIDVAGTRRDFILEVPERVRPGEAVPLLLVFHGWGHSGEGVWQASQFRRISDLGPAISVFPEGLPVGLFGRPPRAGWEIERIDGNRDIALVTALIDRLERDYCIDRQRIYVTGFSNGGYLSHLLGCVMGDRLAAIAPVAGGDLLVACEPKRPLPVMIHHGVLDPVVPIDRARSARDRWVRVDSCRDSQPEGSCTRYTDCREGAEVVFCEEQIQHSWPLAATQRIWEFFRRHSR